MTATAAPHAPEREIAIDAAWRAAAARLARAGIEDAASDAKLLLRHALGMSREDMARAPDRAMPRDARARFDALVARRAARVPSARLVGTREFWSLPFAISPATLIPRPDSEAVIETALALTANRAAAIDLLDLGTGSGCLLLALLSELPAARGLGIDSSEAALRTARANATRFRLDRRTSFLCADWISSVSGRFDLVVSNPPYIPTADIPRLEPEVASHEPAAALDGGADGLDAYRALAPALAALLAPRGRVVLEIGATQHADVVQLLSAHDLRILGTGHDLAGRPRCIAAALARSHTENSCEYDPSR